MKAIRYSAFGGPEVLGLADLDEPHAGPGTVGKLVVSVDRAPA